MRTYWKTKLGLALAATLSCTALASPANGQGVEPCQPAARLEQLPGVTITAVDRVGAAESARRVKPVSSEAIQPHAVPSISPPAALIERQPPGRWMPERVQDLRASITPSAGKMPANIAAAELPQDPAAPRELPLTTYHWEASLLRHQPLYFEQLMLERYGYSHGDDLQPFMSGAQFFANVPVLPLKMLLDAPCQPLFELGYDRPGDPAPPLRRQTHFIP